MSESRSQAAEISATITIYFVSYFLNYVANILISQLFGVQLYSDYAVGNALLTMMGAFALLGFDKATLQYLPRYLSCQKHDLAAHYVRSNFWMILLFSIGLAIVLGTLIVLFEFKHDQALHRILLLSLFMLPLVALVDYLSKLMISKKRTITALIAFKINQPVLLMIFLFSYYFMHGHSGMMLIGCLGLAWLGVLILFVYWLRHDLRYYAKATRPEICWRAWLPRAVPFWICSMVLVSVQNMGVLALEVFNANPKSVAIFAAASQTCHFLIMVHAAVNLLALPRFSQTFSLSHISVIQNSLNEYLRVIFYFCAFFTLMVVFFGKALLGFFGEEFSQGYAVLCVLTAGSIINVYCGLSTSLLQVSGFRRLVLRNSVLLLLLSIILMMILIPYAGILGAACAFSLSMLVVNSIQVLFLQRHLGISFFRIFKAPVPIAAQG